MANYRLKEVEHDGLIDPPPPVRLTHDGKVTPETVISVNRAIASLISAINGGLSIGTGESGSKTGNFNNQWLVFVTPSTANEEFELPHGLGRVPIGFTTWFVDKAAILYVSNYGSWNKERILLKCNTGTASCAIELA